jgi:lipoprotein-releasing system ATP-binding protein
MSASPPDGLLVEDLCKQFPTRAAPIEVLRGISLQLSRGENLAIVGPSGSGKSTLLHLIGTLEPPTSGRITLAGKNPLLLAEPQLADFRNQNIGFVFQDHHLLGQCSVLENVILPALATGNVDAEAVNRGRELLHRVGLAEREDHRPAELSGGERQRVSLARALLLRPLLVLADEPTGNLDRKTGAQVTDLLLELQQEQKTILLVATHSLQLAGRMQRELQLVDGSLEPLP